MLQAARVAPKLLGESAALVAQFLRAQQNEDGGFKDRTGRSDLYYTTFALDALDALRQPLPVERVADFLAQFGDGTTLDFVHLCALVRCRTSIGAAANPAPVVARLNAFRAADGGFHPLPGSTYGTAYGAFLALAAYQDLRTPVPEAEALAMSLQNLATADGAWTNEVLPPAALRAAPPVGATNATAAALTVLRNLSAQVPKSPAAWLLARAHPHGGFLAVPQAPIPDLLSTATTLHALSGLGASFEPVREPCLDFIDSLWTNAGAFHGNWADDHLDCEYTFYGLLALGHLAL
jgi:hypothetical protein